MNIIEFSARMRIEYEWTPEVLSICPQSPIFKKLLVAEVFVSFFEKWSFRISKPTIVYLDFILTGGDINVSTEDTGTTTTKG